MWGVLLVSCPRLSPRVPPTERVGRSGKIPHRTNNNHAVSHRSGVIRPILTSISTAMTWHLTDRTTSRRATTSSWPSHALKRAKAARLGPLAASHLHRNFLSSVLLGLVDTLTTSRCFSTVCLPSRRSPRLNSPSREAAPCFDSDAPNPSSSALTRTMPQSALAKEERQSNIHQPRQSWSEPLSTSPSGRRRST